MEFFCSEMHADVVCCDYLNDFLRSKSAFSKCTELIYCLLGPSCPPGH